MNDTNDKRDIATCGKLYFGKYRGTVMNNIDPMQMGRIQALVPDVLGDLPSSWAMPCLSVGGMQAGMFTVPIISERFHDFDRHRLCRLIPLPPAFYFASASRNARSFAIVFAIGCRLPASISASVRFDMPILAASLPRASLAPAKYSRNWRRVSFGFGSVIAG